MLNQLGAETHALQGSDREMAWWTTLGWTGGTAAGGAAVAVVGVAAVVGYVFVLPYFNAEEPAPLEVALPVPPEIDQPESQPEIQPVDPGVLSEPVEVAPPPPIFDVVRIDAQGAALVAGIAPAGTDVDILLDGVAIYRAATGGDGRFVALFDVPPSEHPRSLQLSAVVRDAGPILSEQTVLVAPFGAVTPVAVADVAPELPSSNISRATSAIAAPEGASVPVVVPTAPALVIADADGVRPLQPARAPAAPTVQPRANVTIDMISYDASGAVQLEGRGSAKAFVRIYLNNAAIDDSLIDAQGAWATVLSDVTPGIYTLRVDELDQAGAVTSRFETPFKREDPALLARMTGAVSAAEPVTEMTTTQTSVEDVAVTDTTDVGQDVEDVAVADVVVADIQENTALSARERVSNAPLVEAGAGSGLASDQVTADAGRDVVEADEAPPLAGLSPSLPSAPAAPEPPKTQGDATVLVASAESVAAQAPDVANSPSVPETSTLEDPAPTTPLASVVTVQPGFTLWQIARDRFGEGELYVQVFEANRDQIRDPDRIFPGQVFTIPVLEDE